MENDNITKLIIGFLSIILAIVMISAVADMTTRMYESQPITNTTVDWTDARILADLPSVNESVTFNVTLGGVMTDASCDLYNGTALTKDADFQINTGGETMSMLNTTLTHIGDLAVNQSLCNITYQHTTYLDSGFNRIGVQFIVGFFALALLGIAIGLFYSILKDKGIIGGA